MPAVWFALKKSKQCRPESEDVHHPKRTNGNKELVKMATTKKTSCGRSGCSRSIANLKDVIHGSSKRHTEKPRICSPRSIGSSELLNPITHEVVLNNSTCELKISGFRSGESGDEIPDFVGMLKPGTPGPGRFHVGRGHRFLGSPIRRTSSSLSRRSSGQGARPRYSFGSDSNGGGLVCHKCGEQFVRWEAVEAHHLSTHAVTELVEGDSSRKIVEIICRAGCIKTMTDNSGIERILKVHNMQKTISLFEEYREIVKMKASKLPKKHPRCLADGNELLRFHGSTLQCSLGVKGSSSLCTLDKCRVCRILRHGFCMKTDMIGIFTASSSGKAFESIKETELESRRKALIVCRVIAGRVHRAVENVVEEMVGFDSLAGHSNIEELYLLSPRALLPCFVVIYKA